MFTHPCCSPRSSHPLPLVPHPCPYVCSLCLHLHCCCVNRFVRTILLESRVFSFWLTSCLIRSRFIHFIRSASDVILSVAIFHAGSNCSLLFWGGWWSCSAPFGFGLPVWALAAELLLGQPSGLSERGAARSAPAARRWRQSPLWPAGAGLCLQSGLGDQLAGAFSPQGCQGSGFWITGLRPGWEEPACLSAPAGRRCRREKWGRSRRFLYPAERWPEVHLRGLGAGGKAPCAKRRVFS